MKNDNLITLVVAILFVSIVLFVAIGQYDIDIMATLSIIGG